MPAWTCVYCGGEWSPTHACSAGEAGIVETLQPAPLIVDDPESLTEAALHFSADDERRASHGR